MQNFLLHVLVLQYPHCTLLQCILSILYLYHIRVTSSFHPLPRFQSVAYIQTTLYSYSELCVKYSITFFLLCISYIFLRLLILSLFILTTFLFVPTNIYTFFYCYSVHVVELLNYYTNHCTYIKFYTLKH